uniref:Uncharacterized protein n=1 Tax=Tetranychus urticae TaxID=32264 RepID=T1KF08_TETUR
MIQICIKFKGKDFSIILNCIEQNMGIITETHEDGRIRFDILEALR